VKTVDGDGWNLTSGPVGAFEVTMVDDVATRE